MTSVTVLGLGPMGQALSAALLDANYSLTVWNRTESKGEEPRSRGAAWAASPADAVAATDITLVNVVDHAVVDSLLEAAGGAVSDRTIVGLTSDTPDSARQTAKLVDNLGGRYLDGAIMTPTPTIGTPSASILFAGSRDTFEAHRELFAALAEPGWLGEDYGRAAAYDMALLDVFWTSVSGFLHALAVAGANGISPGDLLQHARGIVDILPPIFDEIAERVEADRHDESSAPLSSVAASVRHLIATSHAAGVDTGALEAFGGYVDVAVADGHGDEEISRVAPAMTHAPLRT